MLNGLGVVYETIKVDGNRILGSKKIHKNLENLPLVLIETKVVEEPEFFELVRRCLVEKKELFRAENSEINSSTIFLKECLGDILVPPTTSLTYLESKFF